MAEVRFYDEIADELLKFAVIVTVCHGKLVFCKHRNRDTYEIPGGHREAGEDILAAAKRELYEETGAVKYEIKPICVYSVIAPDNFNGEETFGMLYFAEVEVFERELHFEIEKIELFDEPQARWRFPEIQPRLLEEGGRRGIVKLLGEIIGGSLVLAHYIKETPDPSFSVGKNRKYKKYIEI